jgi:hypothetical protein
MVNWLPSCTVLMVSTLLHGAPLVGSASMDRRAELVAEAKWEDSSLREATTKAATATATAAAAATDTFVVRASQK